MLIAAELKQPQNLRRTTRFISISTGASIDKGALGYLIGRSTIHFAPQTYFISLCEKYEFNVTNEPDDSFESV